MRPVYAVNPLSGAGAALWGNRWNSVGVRMAYASTSRPLALLEMLVHVTRETFPLHTVMLPLEIPDNLVSELSELPDRWNQLPYSEETRRTGDRWIAQGSSLAMLVPSAILPNERNIVINPTHALFRQIRVGEPEPHAFDQRLFGKSEPGE